MVRQMFRYAYGRKETSSDEDTIHQLYASFRDSGFHFKDLLIGLVKTPQFMTGLEDNRTGGPPTASARMTPLRSVATSSSGSSRR